MALQPTRNGVPPLAAELFVMRLEEANVLPAWLMLLNQWRDANHFGLTVPFIYGALDSWPGAPLGSDGGAEAKFARMLQSIAEGTTDGTIVRLFKCDTVRDLVFAPVFEVPSYCVPVAASQSKRASLYVQKDLITGCPA